jgi:hypothetical protein
MGLRIGNKTVTEIIQDPDGLATVTRILGGGDISFPSPTADEVEVTDQESDAHEFMQGLVDFGTFTLSGNLDDESEQHFVLTDCHESGETLHLRLTTKSGFTRTYEGFVKGYVTNYPTSEVATFDLEIRINKRITVAGGL